MVRPPTEQGDADQRGLQIIIPGQDRRPLPPVLQPIQYDHTVATCVAKKVKVKTTKHHGRKVKVTTTVCRGGAKLTRASLSSATCGHTKTGHRAKMSAACERAKSGKRGDGHKKHRKGRVAENAVAYRRG